MDDLISVIVLIYRVEKYLDEAVQSILKQTYKNLEIILVDDGSDDNCPAMCDEYARIDNRVKVIHKKNGGIDDARKAGIAVATGKYVGYVDGDDWIEPDMFEKLHEYTVKYNVKVVESGIIDSNGNNYTYRYPTFLEGAYIGADFEKKIEPYLLYSGQFYRLGIMANLSNKLYERTVLTKYQMLPDPSDNIVDDTMCSIPCVAEAKSIYITHECFYHYRVRNNSVKHTVRPDFAKKILSSYTDWINRFQYVKPESNIKKQLDYYLMYILLSKCPSIFDNNEPNKVLIPFGGISRQNKIILHGAGAVGVQLANYISKEFGNNFVLWTDKNYKNLNTDLNVSDPATIHDIDFDYIVIGILWAEKAVSAKKELIELGISKNKILTVENKFIENPELLLANVCP